MSPTQKGYNFRFKTIPFPLASPQKIPIRSERIFTSEIQKSLQHLVAGSSCFDARDVFRLSGMNNGEEKFL
jgi:hypothetical protein